MNRNRFLLFTFLSLAPFLQGRLVQGAENDPQIIISAGKGGFLLTSPDGDFQLRIRGYVQADGRFFFDQSSSAIDTFVLRRSSSQEVINGTNRADIRNEAWNLTGHFVLSGEPAGYKGVAPKNPFDLNRDTLQPGKSGFATASSILMKTLSRFLPIR